MTYKTRRTGCEVYCVGVSSALKLRDGEELGSGSDLAYCVATRSMSSRDRTDRVRCQGGGTVLRLWYAAR